MNPARDAIAHVNRIGVQIDGAGPRQRLQRADGGHQLHAVVGGQRLAARDFLLDAVEGEDGAPAAGARIAGTGAVGPDFDAPGRACHRTAPSETVIPAQAGIQESHRKVSSLASGFPLARV